MDLSNYRIRRVDNKNLTIRKWNGTEWRTISYHGNSANSLISGIFELIMSQYTPEKGNLLDALAEVRLTLISGIEEVEKMIVKEWCKDETRDTE